MKELLEQRNKQNHTEADNNTMLKIIAAYLQRGAIRHEEWISVGLIYEKSQ